MKKTTFCVLIVISMIVSLLPAIGQETGVLCHPGDDDYEEQDNQNNEQDYQEQQNNEPPEIPPQLVAQRLYAIQHLLAQRQEQIQDRVRTCRCGDNQVTDETVDFLCHSYEEEEEEEPVQNIEPPEPMPQLCACSVEVERIEQQTDVRLSIYGMLMMRDILGKGGSEVSDTALEFGSSYMAQTQAENRIMRRSRFTRFFTGGDYDAASDLEQLRDENMQRIGQLKLLNQQVETGANVQTFQGQLIQVLEQEQNKLNQVAIDEIGKTGVFNWWWR